MEETYYIVELHFNEQMKNGSRGFVLKGSVEFYKGQNFAYGNGYGMFIDGLTEPVGGQAYDIRYDGSFSESNPILYITKFFTEKKYREGITLIGIKVSVGDKLD